ncbi:hypothetical protein T484DRAFT_1788629, partial [Baffinella frigidus]
MEDPAEQWRRQILSHVLAEGPLLFSDVGQVVKRPPGFTQKLGAPPLLSVVGGDPRFIVKGHGHAMTLSAAAPRRVLARPAAAAPDPGGMDDLAEQWRRQIHAGLLSEGPQLFLHVGKLARRPDGFNQKLRSVIGDDSRFVIKGDGHAMELSAAPARRVPARPAAAELPDRQERMGWAMANNKARARARLLQDLFGRMHADLQREHPEFYDQRAWLDWEETAAAMGTGMSERDASDPERRLRKVSEIYRAWPSADRPKFAHHLHIKGWNKALESILFLAETFGGEDLLRTARDLAHEADEPLSEAPASTRTLRAQPPPPRPSATAAPAPQPPAFPRRPGQPECDFYMQHGKCAYGAACIWDHPPRVGQAPPNAGKAPVKDGAAGGGKTTAPRLPGVAPAASRALPSAKGVRHAPP